MPYPPTKSGWDALAGTYPAGTKVCGCKDVVLSGKKLYRLVNYFATVTGIAMTDTPPDNPGAWSSIGTVTWQLGPTILPYPALVFTGVPTGIGGTVVLQSGLGLENPIIAIGAYPDLIYAVAPSPIYEAWILAIKDGMINYCAWDFTGSYCGAFSDPVTITH
jgi:hypothetical protein